MSVFKFKNKLITRFQELNEEDNIVKKPEYSVMRNEEQKFECDICLKKYKTKTGITKHCVLHIKVKNIYNCLLCTKSFKNIFELRSHKRKCHKIIKLKCEHCDTYFTTEKGLKRHIKIAHKKDNLSNTLCNNILGNKIELRGHKKEIKRNSFQCYQCCKIFKTEKELKNHNYIHIKNDCPYKCNYCPQSFNTSLDLSAHKTVHRKKHIYQCHICDNVFKTAECFKTHSNIHKNYNRSYQCSICLENFQSNTQLRHHKKNAHKNARKYPCDICCSIFKTKEELLTHIVIHPNDIVINDQIHNENDTKNEKDFSSSTFQGETNAIVEKHSTCSKHSFYCYICQNNYNTNLELDIHQKNIHSELIYHFSSKQQNCFYPFSLCPHVFKNVLAFDSHYFQFHSKNIEPFYCQICNENFTSKSQLDNHVMTYHETYSYQCLICCRKFRTDYELLFHKNLKHSKLRTIFKCIYCYEIFDSNSALEDHIRVHKIIPYKCDKCSQEFRSLVDRNLHIDAMHSKCTLCTSEFKTESNVDLQSVPQNFKPFITIKSEAYDMISDPETETVTVTEVKENSNVMPENFINKSDSLLTIRNQEEQSISIHENKAVNTSLNKYSKTNYVLREKDESKNYELFENTPKTNGVNGTQHKEHSSSYTFCNVLHVCFICSKVFRFICSVKEHAELHPYLIKSLEICNKARNENDPTMFDSPLLIALQSRSLVKNLNFKCRDCNNLNKTKPQIILNTPNHKSLLNTRRNLVKILKISQKKNSAQYLVRRKSFISLWKKRRQFLANRAKIAAKINDLKYSKFKCSNCEKNFFKKSILEQHILSKKCYVQVNKKPHDSFSKIGLGLDSQNLKIKNTITENSNNHKLNAIHPINGNVSTFEPNSLDNNSNICVEHKTNPIITTVESAQNKKPKSNELKTCVVENENVETSESLAQKTGFSFICDICPDIFDCNSQLIEHNSTHHGVNSYNNTADNLVGINENTVHDSSKLNGNCSDDLEENNCQSDLIFSSECTNVIDNLLEHEMDVSYDIIPSILNDTTIT